jgi:hypothetical protein
MESHSKREFAQKQADQHGHSLSVHDRSAIEALAQDTGADLALVIELYERELAHLEATATVRGFLPVLAGRNVRIALRADPAALSNAQSAAEQPTDRKRAQQHRS